MKHTIYLLLIVVLGMSCGSCQKNTESNCRTEIQAPAAQVSALEQYLTDAGISATKDERGFFYTIEAAGNGEKPNACSDVSVGYIGQLMDGTVFDEQEKISFNLSQLIPGWQEGIPLIAPGGKIILYLPPALAYGSQGSPGGEVPPDANLIFTITLHEVGN